MSDNLYTWVGFFVFFFLKLFHAIIIMIKVVFCFKCICCFLNVPTDVSYLRSLTIQILFNNTNIMREDSTHWTIKASVRSVVRVDFWSKFYHLSPSFIAFIGVFRTRSNLSFFVNTGEFGKSWVQISGRPLFFLGLNVNYLSTLCFDSPSARHE